MQSSWAENADSKRRSPDWFVAIGWFCLATYSVLVDHRFLMAVAQVLLGLGYIADNVLLRQSNAKWRVYLLRGAAAVVLVCTLWPKLQR
jgi:hypothetical protein